MNNGANDSECSDDRADKKAYNVNPLRDNLDNRANNGANCRANHSAEDINTGG